MPVCRYRSEERWGLIISIALERRGVARLTDGSGRALLAAAALDEPMPTQRIFARKRLAALVAPEWLDTQVDTLVPLQVVVAVLTVSLRPFVNSVNIDEKGVMQRTKL